MIVKAQAKSIRQAAKKVRLSADLVRGLKVGDALDQLRYNKKASAVPISKLIQSAVANATHNFNLDKGNLFVKEIKVDEGVVLKRWMPRAFGRATPIRKKTSHITILLGELNDSGIIEAVKRKIDTPLKLSSKPTEEEAIKSEPEAEKNVKEEEGHESEAQDVRMEGYRGNAKVDGSASGKGFVKTMFRRKAG